MRKKYTVIIPVLILVVFFSVFVLNKTLISKTTIENAIEVTDALPKNSYEGQVILVHSRNVNHTPAVDEDVGIVFSSPIVKRTKQKYSLTSLFGERDWRWVTIDQTNLFGSIQLGGYTLDQSILNTMNCNDNHFTYTLTNECYFEIPKKGRTFFSTSYYSPSLLPVEIGDIYANTEQFYYEAWNDKGDSGITVIGIQKGDKISHFPLFGVSPVNTGNISKMSILRNLYTIITFSKVLLITSFVALICLMLKRQND